jgi:hypothetical protein
LLSTPAKESIAAPTPDVSRTAGTHIVMATQVLTHEFLP